MIKAWKHRHELFSRFDEGVQFDREGFEAAKSETVANFVAKHLPGNTVLDAFTGIGGSAIGFAREGKKVISVEIDAKRSKMAQHNAAIYGVAKRINFIVGDTMKLWKNLAFDAAYLDPSWGGVGYEKFKSLRFSSFEPNVMRLVRALLGSGKNVAVTLPLNFDLNELKRVQSDVRLYFNDQYEKPYCIHCIWRAEREDKRDAG